MHGGGACACNWDEGERLVAFDWDLVHGEGLVITGMWGRAGVLTLVSERM